MSLTFRQATSADLAAVESLYDHTFTAEERGLSSVGWKRGIYPTTQILVEALARGELFLEEADGVLVGAAVFNQHQSDYYDLAPWQVDAAKEEVMVMHTFAIDPAARGQGFGRAMANFYEAYARAHHCRALRIDTSHLNHAALHLYAQLGYKKIAVHPYRFNGLPELQLVLLEKSLESEPFNNKTGGTPMTLTFRKATAADLDAVAGIYDRIHNEEEAGRTTIGWVRDIYPTRATAEAALARDDLFLEEANGYIVGTAIINHLQGDEYAGAPWAIDAPDSAIMVMHTLVIDPAVKSKGYGSAFVDFYERYAKDSGCQALRMDTNIRNTPARSLYAKLGYQEIAVVPCRFNGIDGVELVLLEKKID